MKKIKKAIMNLYIDDVMKQGHPSEFKRCSVTYNGVIGGEPFARYITPEQAFLLSDLASNMGGRLLSSFETKLLRGLPSEWINQSSNKRKSITGRVQSLEYHLFRY